MTSERRTSHHITSLHGLLAARAAEAPDAPLYTVLDGQGAERCAVSAERLWRWAAAIADDISMASGAPVLVCTEGDETGIAALFGCFVAGAIAVPVAPPKSGADDATLEAIAGVAKASGARHLLAPDGIGPALVDRLAAALGPDAPSWVPLTDAMRAAPAPAPAGERQPALLLYTSGSTGDPKGVVITHDAFVHDMRAMVGRCLDDSEARVCTWLPHTHIAGLYNRMLALVTPRSTVLMPAAAFTGGPARWLDAISRYRCTFAAAPDFAYALLADVLTDEDVARLDLSRWTAVVSGGEVVRPATMDRVFARLAPTGLRPSAMRPYYGMTETLCTAIPGADGPLRVAVSRAGLDRGRVRPPAEAGDAVELFGHGPPLSPQAELRVVDPESRRPCPPGRIGELWMRGPTVTPSHRQAPASIGRLVDGAGPFFRTGDLGVVHQGQVFVTGRLREVLIVRGKNHYPTDLEATAQRALGLPGQRCAAFTVLADGLEALGLAIEVEVGRDDVASTLRAVRRAVATRHGLCIAQLFFVPPGTLPRTGSQKISRRRCRDLAASGAWHAFAAAATRRAREQACSPVGALSLDGLSGPALRATLGPRIASVFAEGPAGTLDAAQLEGPMTDLGLDSLELARIARRLRELTGVEPPFSALFDGSSVRDLVHRMATRVAGGREGAGDVRQWRVPVRALARALPDVLPPPRQRAGAVLMTGATGFLGRYLLAELLAGGATVECLVRATDAAHGVERLVGALRAGPGWREGWRARLRAVPGDVTRPRLGLDRRAWDRLGQTVATIVHNAADVNFVAPYAALAPVNVAPLHALCDLATSGDETKAVHLVSTLAVFNATQRREHRLVQSTDFLLKPDFHYSGYAQSKWVAEACARVMGSRGVPVGLHRPGIITGHSATGHTNADDFLCRLIKGCIQLGHYPDSSVELDLVTVDDVAEGIAATTASPPTWVDTYHWSSSPRGTSLSHLMEVFRARGHAMRPEPLQRWLDRIRAELPMHNALFPLHPFLLEVPAGCDETILEHFDGLPLVVETAEADAARAAAGLRRKPVDDAVLHRIAAGLERSGDLDPVEMTS